ncbi:hypothetical protein CERZMDRAFT_95503 [Cercospora zeae-maydis SCOH1-5]|uniref:Tat pathway signal sequence n=1 Tax=Cercospora zeae-maydis SCOH1-5 TaxID=717836 RepID=A0A6A6FL85_9PEZI|nr:hypothetical protein CERZMDRAFT_95503 [Cercospora zeae-maydis SCOH1-5]
MASSSDSTEMFENLEALDGQQDPLLPSEASVKMKKHRRSCVWVILGLSYVLVAGLASVFTRKYMLHLCSSERKSSFLDGIDRSFHIERGNSVDFQTNDEHDPHGGELSWNNFTISYEQGGDDIERWWLDLGTYTTPILVPEKFAADFGFDPRKHELVHPGDPGWQAGEVPYTGYPASIEVMHKMHCLDLLRQASFYNHEYYASLHSAPWSHGRDTLMRHVGHCVDILRQKIMCDAEIDMVPFLKGTGKTHHPRNDWTLPKKCRNFDSVRSWLWHHQWVAGDSNFKLNDHHSFTDRQTFTEVPLHSMGQLWRGY